MSYYSLISIMPKAQPLLLDTYTGASVAYSLRKLRTAYSGSAIRVRRSSDNTEQNIGFVNNVLDTASLNTFCSGANGFVTTWYDQSGNNINLTNGVAVNQFKIYDSITGVILLNSKPSMTTGFDKVLTSSYFFTPNYTNGVSAFCVMQQISQLGGGFSIDYISSIGNGSSTNGQSNSLYITGSTNNPTNYVSSCQAVSFSTAFSSGQKILSQFFKSGANSFYINGSLINSNTNSLNAPQAPPHRLKINQVEYLGVATANMYIQEYVLYNSDQFSNRVGIETNIDNFY
jgi:hypothetical protein